MKLLRGGTAYLPAYFEDSSNTPLTGEVANITYGYRYLDDLGGATGVSATKELGGGWYSLSYTDTTAKDFVYWAEHTTAKGFAGGIVEIDNIRVITSTAVLPATATETSLYSYHTSELKAFRGIRLDMTNVTGETTIRVKEIIDGVYDNFRTIDSVVWDSSMDPGIPIAEFVTDKYVTISAQSSVAEATSRNIPYILVVETF